MILIPNRTLTHRDDVYERVREEYRRHQPKPRLGDHVDEASRDSFPASDAPPWTLGYTGPTEVQRDRQPADTL